MGFYNIVRDKIELNDTVTLSKHEIAQRSIKYY